MSPVTAPDFRPTSGCAASRGRDAPDRRHRAGAPQTETSAIPTLPMLRSDPVRPEDAPHPPSLRLNASLVGLPHTRAWGLSGGRGCPAFASADALVPGTRKTAGPGAGRLLGPGTGYGAATAACPDPGAAPNTGRGVSHAAASAARLQPFLRQPSHSPRQISLTPAPSGF